MRAFGVRDQYIFIWVISYFRRTNKTPAEYISVFRYMRLQHLTVGLITNSYDKG
uniref:Uncharacterized protein n=1 Tax=Anguilla anguilla TaxID=7936 RepID=A0A0E9RD65_ANGAN